MPAPLAGWYGGRGRRATGRRGGTGSALAPGSTSVTKRHPAHPPEWMLRISNTSAAYTTTSCMEGSLPGFLARSVSAGRPGELLMRNDSSVAIVGRAVMRRPHRPSNERAERDDDLRGYCLRILLPDLHEIFSAFDA